MIRRALDGVALALSWLTVLPVRGPDDVDRDAGRRAITAAPIAGGVLGLGAALVGAVASGVGVPAAAAGVMTVGFLAMATRGMHVDGTSDTADGLGCYGSPERAREVMHGGGAGPFGVATLVVVLGLQAVAFTTLADAQAWPTVVFAVALGRVAVVVACRRGTVAAPGSRFGALVAGTQGPWSIGLWSAAAIMVSPWVFPGPWFAGPAVVVAALVGGAVFTRHCVRRFGGLVGDVLGAVVEGTVAFVAVAAVSVM